MVFSAAHRKLGKHGLAAAFVLVATLAAALAVVWATATTAGAQEEATVPAKPTGLQFSTEPGSLDVGVSWDDVDGATEYLVRWREAGPGHKLTDGVRPQSSATTITVADYGEWVVRVEACNNAGCGRHLARRFKVEPAPEPTPTPTPEPTPEPTPAPTPEPTPEIPAKPTGLRIATQQGSLDVGLDWTHVEDAASYRVRWRPLGPGRQLNEGVSVAASGASITVADYGDWVVRLQGCNEAGCGPGATLRFTVEPLPETVAFVSVCDRTPQVRDALAAALGKDCSEIARADLGQVAELDVSETGVTTLRPGDFDGLTSMKQVNLRDNQGLTALPATVFADASGVKDIDLHGAGLTALSDRQFADMPNLRLLDLSNNSLTTLPVDVFDGSTNIRYIGLDENSLTTLPEDVFDGLSNLQWLDVNGNNITALPSDVFDGLTRLEELTLGGNQLTSTGLPADVFAGLTGLKWISLANNTTLTGLNVNLFSGLSTLERLNLHSSGLTASGLPANVFQPLSGLQELWLIGNPGAPFTLTGLGIAAGATATQRSAPANLAVEPGDGQVTLVWDDPGNSAISHQYGHIGRWGDWSDWTAASPTASGGKLRHTVTGLASGTYHVFRLRSEQGGSASPPLYSDAVILGTAGDDTLTGTLDADHIAGLGGNDTLSGDNGDDTLSGDSGDDTLDGGAGNDTASYANAPFSVRVNLNLTGAQNTGQGNDTLVSIENVIGSSSGDNLTGLAASASVLNGGDGGDLLTGGAGDDTFLGGPGSDRVNYSGASSGVTVDLSLATAQNTGQGNDTFVSIENLTGSAHDDTLTGNNAANDISGGAGDDTVSYASAAAGVTVNLATPASNAGDARGDTLLSIKCIAGSSHNDTLTGDENDNCFDGGAGVDTLNGGAGVDTLSGGDGNDTLNGGDGVDDLSGGDGNDTLNGGGASDTLSGGAGNDLLSGGNGHDVISGGAGNDNLSGNAGNDNLSGGAGTDLLSGGGGSDILEGGPGGDTLNGGGGGGRDIASYASASAGVTVNLATPASNTGDAQGDNFTHIHDLLGSAHNDTLTGDNLANIIEGGAGRDALDGGGGNDTASYSTASAGVTVNLATPADNTGDAQGDTFTNIETILGSPHDDTLTGDGSANILAGTAGDDTLSGGAGDDRLNGATGDDTLNGDAGDDTLIGGDDDDTLNGGAGDDALIGGDDDTLNGGAGDDEFFFWASFGADSISDYTLGASTAASEKIHLCMGTASNKPTYSGSANGSDHVITVTFNSVATGAITLTGQANDANIGNVNIVNHAADGTTCAP